MTSHETPEDIDDSTAPLIEHLTELRQRLIYSVVAFIAGIVVCFGFATPIFNFLTGPLCEVLAERGQNCELIFIKPQEGFFVAIKISMLGGFALAFPVISYQLWRFVAPGLYKSEKGAMLPFLIASPFMFFVGAAFAFYIVSPLAYQFFLGFQQMGSEGELVETTTSPTIMFQGSAQEYLDLTVKFIVAFGLCFQLPVLLTLLGKAGLASSRGLADMRKYAVVGILVLAAIATPPDIVSQVILFTAVYGLYEVSIFLVRQVEKGKDRAAREEGIIGEDESLFDPIDDEFDDFEEDADSEVENHE